MDVLILLGTQMNLIGHYLQWMKPSSAYFQCIWMLDWSLFWKNNLSTLATPVRQGLWYTRPLGAFRSQKLLKLRSPWIVQFYEVISWRFRLIKCSDAGKLTFFSLKWSWNDFKSKICLNWSQKVHIDKIWGQWAYWAEV